MFQTMRSSRFEKTSLDQNVKFNSQNQTQSPNLEKIHHNELYHEAEFHSKPWWKVNFFFSKPVLYTTWDGVYISCLLHFFGMTTLIRAGYIVGHLGIIASILMVLVSLTIACVAVMAGIKISERMAGGTIHFCLSHVLGARLGGAVTIVYCFAQCVNCALHVAGFVESIPSELYKSDQNYQAIIGVGLVVIILFVNIAGVKWVVRLQFIILIVLVSTILNFAVGLFVKKDAEHGVIGYQYQNLIANLKPENMNVSKIFSIFFPALTGIYAGINMSNDLYNPKEAIPKGTYSALGTSFCLYLLFMVGLGSVCTRSALLTDTMIADKASFLSYLLLISIYVSSMSTCLGIIYTTPRIIQDMAKENILPGLDGFAKGKGPNKIPIWALVLFSLFVIAFVMVQSVNTLATIVTIPYLMTFAFVEYSYFSLLKTQESQLLNEEKLFNDLPCSPSIAGSKTSKINDYGSVDRGSLDQLFAKKGQITQKIYIRRQQSSPDTSDLMKEDMLAEDSSIPTPEEFSETNQQSSSYSNSEWTLSDKSPYCFTTIISNKYIVIFAAIIKFIFMFWIHWVYAFSLCLCVLFFWLYIGHANPGAYPGVSRFNLIQYIKTGLINCFRKHPSEYQEFIIPSNPYPEVTASQLTQEGTDFASRERYHQATTSQIQNKIPNSEYQN